MTSLPVFSSRTFADRYVNFAPAKPSLSKQPSTGWHPPFWSRSSSVMPSSYSWLPVAEANIPSWLKNSTVGSSWNRALSRGEPPTRSPAPTSMEYFSTRSLRSCFTWVARYSAPPASTLVPESSTIRPLLPGRRLEVAVEVVHRQQLEADITALAVVTGAYR